MIPFRERRCRFSNSSRHWCPSSVWSNRSPISTSSAAFISRLKRSRTRTRYYVLQNIISGSEVLLIQFGGSLNHISELIKSAKSLTIYIYELISLFAQSNPTLADLIFRTFTKLEVVQNGRKTFLCSTHFCF